MALTYLALTLNCIHLYQTSFPTIDSNVGQQKTCTTLSTLSDIILTLEISFIHQALGSCTVNDL